jgi:hypothetical protein
MGNAPSLQNQYGEIGNVSAKHALTSFGYRRQRLADLAHNPQPNISKDSPTMRTETTTRTIYQFEELNDSAKEKARNGYLEGFEYFHGDDALDSIKALAEHFNGRLYDWNVDYSSAARSSLKFSMPEMSAFEIRCKLGQLGKCNPQTGKGIGECKLTGMCFDEDCIDGFRDAWRNGERDLTELMRSAGESLLHAIECDYDYQTSNEAVDESIIINEYDFDEFGNIA